MQYLNLEEVMWSVVKSVLVALLGVQNDRQRQQDFSTTSQSPSLSRRGSDDDVCVALSGYCDYAAG